MARLVMKFGGTSVADMDRIRNVARHVAREVKAGHEVAVVVSAMSGKTNELVAWCTDASRLYDPREYDAVVASGEQVTAGLLAIALQEAGIPTAVHYPMPIPLQPAYMQYHHPGQYPVAIDMANKVMSLPMGPYMKREEVRDVAEVLLLAAGRDAGRQAAVAALSV